jgi:hypothetical protein
MTVKVGPNTLVARAGQNGGSLASGVISVGQRIQVFGDVSRDGTGGLEMDATAGLVRLNYTRLFGLVTASEPGKVTLDLHSIHGLRHARFDFDGTGATPLDDADPDAYEVAAGPGLTTAALPAGAYTRVFGFVAPFGLAPPDFNARTLVDYSASRASLGAVWLPDGVAMPFSVMAATGLTLDPAFPPAAGAIRVGGAVIGLDTLATGVTLTLAGEQARRSYVIAHRGSGRIETFSDFGEFVATLQLALDGQTRLYKLVAYGSFDGPAVSFGARQVLVVLND